MDIKKIDNVSAKTEQAIQRKSAYALPDRPSESGMRADEIKKAFYSSITDKNDSVLSEFKRVVNESNNIFEEMQGEINDKLTKNNIDKELSNESENAVQNKVLYNPVVFAESERQKSKNLLGANLKRTHTSNGITYTVNDDGSITMQGTATWNSTFKLDYLNLPAGTYIGSVRNKSDNSLSTESGLQIHYENIWNNVYVHGIGKTHTLTETKYCDFELFINNGTTIDKTVYVQLEKSDTITEYQAYNGAIVHEKDIQRQIITGSLIAGFDVPDYTEYHIAPLVENKKIGNKLTMNSNGGVVIGAGVKNVLINVSTNIYVSTIGYHRLRIYKNNTVVLFKYEQTKDTGGRAIPLDITPFLLDVAEGDIITLRFQTTTLAALQGGEGMPTYMTVEVVE